VKPMPHLALEWGGRILAALCAAIMAAFCAGAAAAESYTVGGVKVQATGPKPELARAKAVADGEMTAFNRLLRRMTLPEDHARLPKPPAESVRGAILNFSIENESQQGDKYAATVAYRFDKDAIRAMLEGAGVPFVDAPSPPIIVLPVWSDAGKQYLWDDPNPWREAWMRHEPEDALADFTRVRGDLADLKAISAEEAAAGNREALNRIADQYKAGLVAIAVATIDKGKRRIAVQLVDLANARATPIGTFPVGDDASGLDKAAAEVARAIDIGWKRAAVALERNAAVVRLRAPIQGLDHWIRIRQTLEAMAQIRGLNTVSMSAGEALVEVRFAGTLAELRRQLEQRGFTVAPESGTPASAGPEIWLVSAPSVPPVRQTDLPPQEAQPPEKAPERAPPGEKNEPDKKP
ncbi:MAG: DUF2066 domain-containing protein, partial [Alphaproteobacteria bacterium]